MVLQTEFTSYNSQPHEMYKHKNTSMLSSRILIKCVCVVYVETTHLTYVIIIKRKYFYTILLPYLNIMTLEEAGSKVLKHRE